MSLSIKSFVAQFLAGSIWNKTHDRVIFEREECSSSAAHQVETRCLKNGSYQGWSGTKGALPGNNPESIKASYAFARWPASMCQVPRLGPLGKLLFENRWEYIVCTVFPFEVSFLFYFP